MSRVVENTSPNGWDLVRLEELSDISIGKTPPRSKKELFFGNNIWLSIRDLNGDVVSVSNEKITDEAVKSSNMKIISEGTLLMSFKLTLGKTSFAGCDLYTNEAIASLPIKDETVLNKYFLKYALATIDLEKEVDNAVKGKTLNKQKLKNLEIPLPPLEEQKRIVAKIDTLFAKIDKAISLTEESLKQAKNLLPSVLKEVFENLDSPKSSLSEFCSDGKKHMVGGPFGSNLKATEYVDKGYPIIRLQNVNRFDFIEKNIKFVTQEKAEFLKSHSYVSGDIVLTKLGAPLGKCCIVKKVCGIDRGVISADIVRIRINEKENIKEFVVAGINSEVIRKQLMSKTQGATRPRVTLKELRQMILPKPSYEEQLIIVDKIKYLKDKSKKIQSKLEEQLAYLQQLKSSILSKAFKGEL